jgi:tRNA threonylcarbamoyladenosine biosynthesis protein TsaB
MKCCLGIDCSSIELGLGLYADGRPLASLSRYSANSHSEQIRKAVDYLLDSQGLAPSDLESVGVAVGPGSFTGLRIGIAFLKGLVFSRDARVLALSSLESVAVAWAPRRNGPLVVAFDARRDEVFWARFAAEDATARRLTDDAVSSAEAFVGSLAPDDTVVTDTVGFSRSTVFAGISSRANVYPLEEYPIARGLACACAASREPLDSSRWTTPLDVVPAYLRQSYAEERRTQQETAL